MKEQDIVFEVGNFWVRRVKSGQYEIYKAGVTASVRAGADGKPPRLRQL